MLTKSYLLNKKNLLATQSIFSFFIVCHFQTNIMIIFTSHLFNNSVYLDYLVTPATPSTITPGTHPAALYLPPTHLNIAISNTIELLTGVYLIDIILLNWLNLRIIFVF